jgi:hypothetical protein
MADNEGHFLRRTERGGNEKIALVLAVIVIGNDHEIAFGESLDRRFNSTVGIGHSYYLEFLIRYSGTR